MIAQRGEWIFVIIWEINFTCEIHATAQRERFISIDVRRFSYMLSMKYCRNEKKVQKQSIYN
jgi:hypothetical protein